MQLDAQLLRRPQGVVALGFVCVPIAYGVGVAFDAEAGIKIESLHVYSLIQDQARGQERIEPAGNQGHGFAGWCHVYTSDVTAIAAVA